MNLSSIYLGWNNIMQSSETLCAIFHGAWKYLQVYSAMNYEWVQLELETVTQSK